MGDYNEGYNQGYEDALRWVLERTNGDNYKEQVLRNLLAKDDGLSKAAVSIMEF